MLASHQVPPVHNCTHHHSRLPHQMAEADVVPPAISRTSITHLSVCFSFHLRCMSWHPVLGRLYPAPERFTLVDTMLRARILLCAFVCPDQAAAPAQQPEPKLLLVVCATAADPGCLGNCNYRLQTCSQ